MIVVSCRSWLKQSNEKLHNLPPYLCFQLLKQSVFDPQVNIPPPESLFLSWGDLSNGALIYFAHTVNISCTLFQLSIVEPDVVVFEISGEFLQETKKKTRPRVSTKTRISVVRFQCELMLRTASYCSLRLPTTTSSIPSLSPNCFSNWTYWL